MILKDVEKIMHDFIDEIERDISKNHTADLCLILVSAPTVDAIPVEQVAEMFINFTGDYCPCNYNGMDEKAFDDEFCENHCDLRRTQSNDCWLHAIKEGWLDE